MKKYIAPNIEIIRLETTAVMQEWLAASSSHASVESNPAPSRKDWKPVF